MFLALGRHPIAGVCTGHIAGFPVVCLPASILIDLFHKSNLTTIIAISGANLFKNLNVGVLPLMLMFALSLMLPYSLFLLIFRVIYLGIWLLLGLDTGPGVSIFIR